MRHYLLIILLLLGGSPVFSQHADIAILRKINLQRNESLDPAFRLVTESVVPLSAIVPLGFMTAYLVKKDSLSKSNTVLLFSSVAVAGILSTTLKYSIHRQRPFAKYKDIEKLTPAGSLSFPSGHTSLAFSLATSVSFACPKWYVITPSFLWASSVAYSRMHLGVHYPSDVLAGAIIGSGSAFLSYKINKWLVSRCKNGMGKRRD